ncbi:glycosyltransferase [Pleurocapsales cyanobacterium LEGE 06147]|nr:glycosyltransferase [Pleurocapsales cyanobacterium LEGE 06147]
MKITLIAHVLPYPPLDGGRIDIWRRLKAFSQYGIKIQLISWIHHPLKEEELAKIQKYTQDIHFIKFKKTPGFLVRRIIDLWSYPLEVTSRISRGKELSNLLAQVSNFNPDLIFLDGIHGGEIATYLSKNLNVPMVTRSHNIEHVYQQRLLESAIGWRKFRKKLSLTNLESYEKKLLKNSIRFYDISVDDLKYWQEQGFTNGRYLPPLIESFEKNSTEKFSNQINSNFIYDVVFLGNLNAENNVAGLIWFLTQVVPLVRSKLPSVKILIAGLNPINKIKQLCNETEGVELKINPASSAVVYSSGRVLVNPISAGSGVSIKSIEMLASGRPIVSRSQGLSGLPDEIKQYFKVADEAQSFAEEIVRCLSTPPKLNIEPELLDSFFGFQVIKNVLSELEAIL